MLAVFLKMKQSSEFLKNIMKVIYLDAHCGVWLSTITVDIPIRCQPLGGLSHQLPPQFNRHFSH